jgi:hypothetical protein
MSPIWKAASARLAVAASSFGPATNPYLRQSAARNSVDHHALAINHAGSTGVGSAAVVMIAGTFRATPKR